MIGKLLAGIERAVVAALLVVFALPLAISLALRVYPEAAQSDWTLWLRNATLGGVQIAPEALPDGRGALFDARFQDALTRNFNFHFAGRELLIRLTDELYRRLFHTSSGTVLIGRHETLFETTYVDEYCLRRSRQEELRPLVEELRRTQEACDERGVAFAFLITPNKASIYPEDLPPAWRRRHRPEPRPYDQLLPLLQEKGVRYVDGHAITMAAKGRAPAPVFPRGGLHWSQPAALLTANSLLETLARQGLNLRPISTGPVTVSDQPAGQDYDLASLINVAVPLHYPVATLTVMPQTPGRQRGPNLVVVGGSFLWNMLAEIDASREASETELYFYYRTSKSCGVDATWHEVENPVKPVNFATDVFAADALVLEANEETISGGAAHLKAFMDDALAALPDAHAIKPPFHRLSRMAYRWGDTLGFAKDDPATVTGRCLSSFTAPWEGGAYTLGPRATVRLDAAPVSPGDVDLEVDASAFLADGKLTEQRARIFVNGHDLGEWVWRGDGASSHQQVTVPHEYLGDGAIDIDFLIAHPGSPKEYGIGADANPYGISLSKLRLRPAME